MQTYVHLCHRKQLRHLLLIEPNAAISRHQRHLGLAVVCRVQDDFAFFFWQFYRLSLHVIFSVYNYIKWLWCILYHLYIDNLAKIQISSINLPVLYVLAYKLKS